MEAVGLTKRYGGRTAVDEVSFSVSRGEVLGLLGPNGAGKTTAIRLLTTMLTPSSGQFRVAGVDCGKPNDIRRRIGVLPESAGYPEHHSGSEYLLYHARLFGLNRTDAAGTTERLLAEVGLADRASSAIATYSRGMRQRLGIARALVNDPAVVFFDEPTLGLDPAGQRQVLGIICDIAQRRGAAVVLSTHALTEVEDVCTSVLILRQGTVLAAGTVAEVIGTVAAQPTAQLRVPSDMIARAAESLASAPGLQLETTADTLRITLAPGGDGHVPDTNAVLRAVLDAAIPVLSFDLEGTRLSDAFLAMTSQEPR
ncbi:ABC transporter [Rhizocola hellebori]|uniref:ABC transporter n=1 Tax=Rhizocola hellebori TaxID=1392758 RepID=A0A8J3VES7_9ACTN|nr:ABC transporter [Rhizocola hellebori]